MVKVTVKKFRVFPRVYDIYTIDSKELGEIWCSFILKTDFCRILPWNTISNRTARIGRNGYLFVVSTETKQIIYNSNYEIDNVRYHFVRDFVEYVLGVYKYKTLVKSKLSSQS